MNPFSFNKSPNPHFSSPSQLRISDILLAGDDGDQIALMGESADFAGKINCSSLRRVISRWLSRLRRSRVKRVTGEITKSEVNEKFPAPTRGSTNCLNEVISADSSVSDAGGGANSSFNLGIGCCLLYLLAASNNELHKMMEMRKKMESILLSSKENLPEKDEPNDIYAYSTTNEQQECPILPESSTVTETLCRGECSEEGMDRLEAELEAELELLQRHLDGEKLLYPRKQERIKVLDENTSSSQAFSYGEVIDPPYQGPDSDCGFPPEELERRLHELLEERQQEQIRELQSALECLKLKLHEKDLEVAWWRDTAKIIAQHATDISCIASKRD